MFVILLLLDPQTCWFTRHLAEGGLLVLPGAQVLNMTQILAGIGLKTDKIKNNLKKRSTEATVLNMKMIQIFTALPGWHPWYDGLWNGKSSSASAGEKVYECCKDFILLRNDSMWKHRSCNTYITYNVLTYSDLKELRPMIPLHSLACPGSGLPSSACALGLLPVTLDTPMNRKFMPDADQWADSDISPAPAFLSTPPCPGPPGPPWRRWRESWWPGRGGRRDCQVDHWWPTLFLWALQYNDIYQFF